MEDIIKFNEPQRFTLMDGDIETEFEIVPLLVEDMPLLLDFIELKDEFDKLKEAAPEEGEKKTQNRQVQRFMFEQMLPMAEEIVKKGLILKSKPDETINIPRRYRSFPKLMEITTLIMDATGDDGADRTLQAAKKKAKDKRTPKPKKPKANKKSS
jgi:hypothetical protein